MLYPSLPDVVPFPGTLCASFRSARSGITGVIDKGLRAPPGPRENSVCPVWLLSLTRQRFVTLSHLQSCSAGAELYLCLILRAVLVLCCEVWPRMPEKLWWAMEGAGTWLLAGYFQQRRIVPRTELWESLGWLVGNCNGL